MQEGPKQEARSQTIRQLGFIQKAKCGAYPVRSTLQALWVESRGREEQGENRRSRTRRQSKDQTSGGGSDKALSEETTAEAYSPVKS